MFDSAGPKTASSTPPRDLTAADVDAWTRAHDHLPTAAGESADERALATWIRRAQERHAAGLLDAGVIAACERIRRWTWDPALGTWWARLDAYRQWARANDRAPSRQAEDPEERALAVWSDGARKMRRDGRLDDARADALLTLPGWRDPRAWRWEKTLAELSDWASAHRRLPARSSASAAEARLNAWMRRQQAAGRSGELTGRQRAACEKVTGWTWGREHEWQRSSPPRGISRAPPPGGRTPTFANGSARNAAAGPTTA